MNTLFTLKLFKVSKISNAWSCSALTVSLLKCHTEALKWPNKVSNRKTTVSTYKNDLEDLPLYSPLFTKNCTTKN